MISGDVHPCCGPSMVPAVTPASGDDDEHLPDGVEPPRLGVRATGNEPRGEEDCGEADLQVY